MNNIIKRVWNQNRLVNIEDLTGMVFQAEADGHTFEISGIDDTGAAVALSGTVSGVFRRPDNADIALTGSASDGVVSVTLSEDCYAVPGRFGLTIFVTSNSQKVAVYACVGTVAVSSTGNVAGDTPANVEDLIDDINAAIADLNSAIGQIPASYANVMAAIAPTYSGSALYSVGSYAWYNGSLYRCTTPITTAEAWTAAHWTAAVLGDDVGDLKSAITQNESAYNDLESATLGMTNLEKQIKYKFYDGEIHSGTQQVDARRCYSELISNVSGLEVYFDDTKYKVLLVYFDSDGTNPIYNTWASASPVTSGMTPSSKPKLRIEAQTKDDSNIDKSDVANTTYTTLVTYNKNIPVRYVSTSGNDTNEGNKTAPFATINKALDSGAEIIYLFGGRYYQQIDLSKAKRGIVDIRRADNATVYFKPVEEQKIATAETLVSGKTKTYQATVSVTLNANNLWLYQEGIADASTLIDSAERMPQQRGQANRCLNTLIKKCTSANTIDAIAEIEASSDYLWYLDGTTLYFSRPSSVSGTNPISHSNGSKLFTNNNRNVSIRMEGINCEFVSINLDYTVGSKLCDCMAGYVFGSGAITYDYAYGVELIRCEACRCNNGNQGDGINGHADTSTGAIKTRRTTATIIDCWSHDNRDDGFSDHNGCESTIIGGLYEYNGKGGVTPSYGAHCACYNVISRGNYNGFYYTGQSADEGDNGQIECYNCVAENNNAGTSQANAGFLVDSVGNSMTLVGCKSVGNKIGYYAPSGTLMRLYECTALDCEQSAAGKARMTIKNGTLIEP